MTGDGNAMLHTDDGAIVQWIDGALSRDERAALDTHFADCAECASRRAVIARRGQRLGKHLRETDLPVPAPALRVTLDSRTRKGIPVQWKIAAVLVLALAGAVAVPEVRAWILAWTRTIGGRNAVPAQGAPPHAGAVSFVPEGPMLTIRVPPRRDARLIVEVVAGEQVTAVGPRGEPLPGLTVLPSEMRIGDSGDSVAAYVVRVPVRLQSVRVIVGERNPQVFRPSAAGERREFPLSP